MVLAIPFSKRASGEGVSVAVTSKARGDAGFGMTELAVAIVVLGIVLVGLFPLMVDSIRLAQRNAEVGQANRVVASNIDHARAEGPGSSCVSGSPVPAQRGALYVSPPSGFTGDVYFTCVDGAGKLVTVRVDVWKTTGSSSSPISTATTKVYAP